MHILARTKQAAPTHALASVTAPSFHHACVTTIGRHTPGRECDFGLQYALDFGTKLGEAPSKQYSLFYRAFLGCKCGCLGAWKF